MAQPLTYQQILAEQYEESARDRLVFQNMEHNEEEDGRHYDAHVNNNQAGLYEIEDQHAYRDFAGNRHLEEDLVKPKEFEDKSKLSVRYNKDVKLNVFNIDSRFRAYAYPGTSSAVQPTADPTYDSKIRSATSSSSHFVFRASKQIKNAMSIKLTSLEMPNTFWNFLASRGNTSFLVRRTGTAPWYTVRIPDGYYQTADQLAAVIQTALTGLNISSVPDADLFTCYAQDGFCYIGSSSSASYDFDFATSPFTYNSTATLTVVQTQLFETLGEMIGFDITNTYTNLNLQTPMFGTYSLDVNPDHYIYLKINDYSTVTPQSINDTYYSVFSKIPITITKGLMIVDNDSTNSTTKDYRFLQPTNIQQLEIQLLDMTGTEIVFRGNFSMTLEIEEVVSHSLYEKLREL
jgi:hypothetical protein